jgi:hypothetical protein
MITADQAGDLLERFKIHLHKASGGWVAMIGHFKSNSYVRARGKTWLEAIEKVVEEWWMNKE